MTTESTQALLLCLSVWQNDQMAMESQRGPWIQPAHIYQAWEDHVCGSAGVINVWRHCTAQGLPNDRPLQVCDDLRGPILWIYLHAPSMLHTSDKKVSAKKAFVKITHYHADNGQFTDHGFVKHCPEEKQSISYCSINAHFQNGLAKPKIHDLQKHTWTALLYTCNKWLGMITAHLWPYAM